MMWGKKCTPHPSKNVPFTPAMPRQHPCTQVDYYFWVLPSLKYQFKTRAGKISNVAKKDLKTWANHMACQEMKWQSCSVEVDYDFWFFLLFLIFLVSEKNKQHPRIMVAAPISQLVVSGHARKFFSNVKKVNVAIAKCRTTYTNK